VLWKTLYSGGRKNVALFAVSQENCENESVRKVRSSVLRKGPRKFDFLFEW
jgi:hypothetical protein